MSFFEIRRSHYGLRRKLRFLAAVIVFLTVFCPQSGFSMSKKLPRNQFFIEGETVFLAKYTAMPSGSAFRIRNTETPLDGVNLYVEPGSVTSPVEIEVSLNTGYLKFGNGKICRSPIIQISIEKNYKLIRPLEIAVPLTAGEKKHSISCFFIKDDGSLSATVSTPATIYEDKIWRFSTYTFHSGLFTWMVVKPR